MFEVFDNYLSGTLPETEKKEFEMQLQDKPEIQLAFTNYAESFGFLKQHFSKETQEFKLNINQIAKQNRQIKNNKNVKVINLKKWVFATAAILLVVLSIPLFVNNNPNYSEYNQFETAAFVERGSEDLSLVEAQNYYNTKQFEKAIIAFTKIKNIQPEYVYFLSIAYLETNNFEAFTLKLEQLKKLNSIYTEKIFWLQALSYLKQKEFEKCKLELQKITTSNPDFEKAQNLLSDL